MEKAKTDELLFLSDLNGLFFTCFNIFPKNWRSQRIFRDMILDWLYISWVQSLKAGDTLTVKFASKINEVCSKKGCWMKLDLADGTETMVRFKDYGFFMPLDANGREVVVNGKAYVTETSIEDLRHYAEDAGKTKEEIAKITQSKVEFAFEADGVLMKK